METDIANEKVVREITGRRVHVLQKFEDFEQKAANKRRFLVQSYQLQIFLRSAREFQQVIESLIKTAEGVNIRQSVEHRNRVQKVLTRLRDEVDGKRHNFPTLEREATCLVEDGHYATEDIQKSFNEIRSRWQYLLQLIDLKWKDMQKENESIDFGRKCDTLFNWIKSTKAIEKTEIKIFDEIRKYSIIWNEIATIYQQMTDPSPIDIENYEKTRVEWHDFRIYIDSLNEKFNEHERLQKFIENAKDVNEWMENKEREIREKYSKINVEDSLKYRKTIEIEIKSFEHRINCLKEERDHVENGEHFQNHQEINDHMEKIENTYRSFQKFIEKWRLDLENASDLDKITKEAEEICFWCCEKTEELKAMETSENVDCDEIVMWIETNNFDFNTWTGAVEHFIKSAQKLLLKLNDGTVEQLMKKTNDMYEYTKKVSEECNEILENRIKNINVEKLIFQTHQKASHLVSVLQRNSDAFEDMNIDDIEKELRMMDGVAVRCISVVEQIEYVENEMNQKPEQIAQLNQNSLQQFNQLNSMKNILKASSDERKDKLKTLLDESFFVDCCCELKKHTDIMLEHCKSGRVKREGVEPIKEQLVSLKNEMGKLSLSDRKSRIAEDELKKAQITIELIEQEHERLVAQNEERRVTERIVKFVERVHQWIDKSSPKKENINFSLESQNLRRIIANYQLLLSLSDDYQKSINTQLSELDGFADEYQPRAILIELQIALDQFDAQVRNKIEELENMLNTAEKMAELNSQNDWIKAKIKSLDAEPVLDCLLISQKMKRRFEKDSEEIENRRRLITEAMRKNADSSIQSIIDEIETNWNQMKKMFDERGGFLERMVKLYEYFEESATTSEWLREKKMYANSIEPKGDESLNRVMVKKLEALAEDVENYKTKIVETHALLEDALVTPKTKFSRSQQVIKLKSALTRRQGEIESDYASLIRLIEKKLKELQVLLQEADVSRVIEDIERWIDEEENQLNKYLTSNSVELSNKLDDALTNVQRRRANLTNLKCNSVGGSQIQNRKIDDAFGMLDVFLFELDRIRAKASRALLLEKLKAEADDVIDSIQATQRKIQSYPCFSRKRGVVGDFLNLDGDLETFRRRVIASLDKAKALRAANADLAPQVYDIEERLEKEWTEVSKAAENRKKQMEKEKLFIDLESDFLAMEQWIDTFNEELVAVTGCIHDGLGVQVGLESIDTWREELSHRVDQLGNIKKALASVLNSVSSNEDRNLWVGRTSSIESGLLKARKAIDAKQDELSEFSNILCAERDCDRLYSWVIGKGKQLETDSTSSDTKTIIRKMDEIEKMMISREGEVEYLRDFLKKLNINQTPRNYKSTELAEKFERLDYEWRYLEEKLKRNKTDFNDSMSQLLIDEQFEKIQQWIDEQNQQTKAEVTSRTKPVDIIERQKQYDKLSAEINEYLPIYEDFLNNENVDDEKVHVIRQLWSSLIETTTIRRKALCQEIQNIRLLDLLDEISLWLTDAEAEVHSTLNINSLYKTSDADKAPRLLKSLNEQAEEKDDLLKSVCRDKATDETVDKLRERISELKTVIKANSEDMEVWKNMQEIVKAIDDEICWYKEVSVIVSSTDVGHDISSLGLIRRKHQRILQEAERRKQKVAKIVDRATELISAHHRPSLDIKISEIDEKLAQLTELLESNSQIAEIRTKRLEKWAEYFTIIDEIREKEHVLEQITEQTKGSPEKLLADVEGKLNILEAIAEQLNSLKEPAEKMSNDEFVRTKTAENSLEKLRTKCFDVADEMASEYRKLKENIEISKFIWKCDMAIQCIQDQEEKIANIVGQQKPTSNFENAVYHSTASFVESFTRETIEKLIITSRQLRGSVESEKKLSIISDKLAALKKQLSLLAEKIEKDDQLKRRVKRIQEDYSKLACDLGNWLEQAEEDVADVVRFQTKESSEECQQTLIEILEKLRVDKADMLGELELLEVELAELNEDVNTFTWYSYNTFANRMERLDQTISDRVRIVDSEIDRHLQNENICEEAARTLQMCRNIIIEVKKDLEHIHTLKLDDQYKRLLELIEKVQGSGMIRELENWRSVMGSRFIFDNKFSSVTPNAVLIDICHCLELMSSMLRSVEQSIAERNSSGVTEKQLREFELAFLYFDMEKKGWLDYEHFELCLKSQGYDFSIETATIETMEFLDPTKEGRILMSTYMRWMVKNETTNIFDDHSAIENALKNLDARKISDSMSRKEAEFFMRKIAQHSNTFTEHIHLEYKDFVDSFY